MNSLGGSAERRRRGGRRCTRRGALARRDARRDARDVTHQRTIHDLFDSADDLRGKSCVPGQSSHKATQTCLRAKTASRRLPRS